MDTINFNDSIEPEFLSNNAKEGKKVLAAIERELKRCDSFFISVAFITDGGLTPLLMTLKELERKQIPGQILTTNFLMFNHPKTLEKLSQFTNIELRIYDAQTSAIGFHTKGYGFHLDKEFTIIMGSSNMTLHALTRNKEWNVYYSSNKQRKFVEEVVKEFEELWESEHTKEYEQYIDEYRALYKVMNTREMELKSDQKRYGTKEVKLQPNSMQEYVIKKFSQLYSKGENKGLLISATGTGKTYASAFAVQSVQPKRVLFLVHREQVAKQAMQSYRRVIGSEKSYGLLSGNARAKEEDYIFATMQMMSKSEVHKEFKPTDFDIIVIDEGHRAGAHSYQKIMAYFTPKFWFAMTASPERTDDINIFKMFDYNIIHEIRLQQALEADLLCPFHYFGIAHVSDEQLIHDGDDAEYVFAYQWDHKTRAKLILEQADFYGYSGERVKGVVFCHSLDEARALSEAFNQLGKRTIYLGGMHSQEERERAITRLSGEDNDNALDYIMTVDIFNEGIDIPEINQVLMVRGTESPIVFVQQLGRGLRRHDSKEYVTVLDFIGNFKNNFMIPIALSGDVSHNKDSLRYYIQEGVRIIPGASTIHFDEVAKERIFKAIDTAKFTHIKKIREAYINLKYKLGRIPKLVDFEEYGSIDTSLIFNSSAKTYYNFLKSNENEYDVAFNILQKEVLLYLGRYLIRGQRLHEAFVLQALLKGHTNPLEYMKEQLALHNIVCTEITEKSISNIFIGNFVRGTARASFTNLSICEVVNGNLKPTEKFIQALGDEPFREMLEDYINTAFIRNQKYYANRYKNTSFVLYQKYSYEDVCQLMEWETSEIAQNLGGYKYDEKTKTYPVFVNYHKEETISETTKYEDKLESPSRLIAISKRGRTTEDETIKTAMNAKELGVAMHLFIRKNKKDEDGAKEFYYLGHMEAIGEPEQFIMPNTTASAVRIAYHLDTPIREDLYDYFISP